MKILLCEDEPNLNRLISKRLQSEGYVVDTCFNGEDGLYYIEQSEYDLIILDVMMPKMHGFEVVEKMRALNIDYPVLFLTARDSDEDIIRGLDLGGNDYVIKPFSFEILLARVRVLIRTKPKCNSALLKILDLEVDTNTRIVKRNNQEIKLTSKEYLILEYLLTNKNMIVSKEQIESRIWDFEGDTNFVKVYIRYLRKKIDDDFDIKLIHTVRGAGYILKGDVENEEETNHI